MLSLWVKKKLHLSSVKKQKGKKHDFLLFYFQIWHDKHLLCKNIKKGKKIKFLIIQHN